MNLVPYAYEDIYLNQEIFPEVDSSFYHLGLQQMAKDKSGLSSVTVRESVESLLCLHNTGVLLNVKTDSPILQIKSTFESGERVVLYCRSYHPGDSYSYQGIKRLI